jgi:hypothetical protein
LGTPAELKNARHREPVEDLHPHSSISNQPLLSKNGEMLGDVRKISIHALNDLAHTPFPLAQVFEYGKRERTAQLFEYLGFHWELFLLEGGHRKIL